MFVRRKLVKNQWYCYLVKSVRDGVKVGQVCVAYLGREPLSREKLKLVEKLRKESKS